MIEEPVVHQGFHGSPATMVAQLVKNLPTMKEAACNAGDLDLIPESGRPPGEGNGNPLQYSCLENPMDRGVWQSIGLQRVGHDLATKPPLLVQKFGVFKKVVGFIGSRSKEGILDERGTFCIHWKLGDNEAVRVDSVSQE